MKITVTVTKELESWWVAQKEMKKMGDEEIIELMKEDIWAFLGGAKWIVRREKSKGA